jgi:hypothetical protein
MFVTQTYEGQSDIHGQSYLPFSLLLKLTVIALILGRAITGIQAFA